VVEREKMVLAKLVYNIICLVGDMIISPIYYNIPIAAAVITIIIPSLSLDSKSVISLDFKLKSPIYSHSHKQNGKHGKQYIRC
jgi:hypothetical protein